MCHPDKGVAVLKSIRLIFSQFSKKEKLQLLFLFFTTTINGLVQALGIVSVMPLIALLTDPTLADTHQYFLLLKEFIPEQFHHSLLLVLGVIAFLILLLGNAFVVFDYWLTLKFFNVKEFKLSIKLFSQYMQREYLNFKKVRISDMARNVVSEVDRVIVGTLLSLVGLVSDFIIAISIVALLVYVNVWVTVIASLLIGVMYSLVYFFIVKKIELLGEEFSVQESRIFAAIRQNLELFREIRVARKSGFFMRKYTKPAKAITRNATRYNILKLYPEQIIEVFAFGLVIFIAIYFSTVSDASALVISSIAFFAFAVYRLIPIVKDIFDGIEELRFLDSSLTNILEEFDTSLLVPKADVRGEALLKENIEFSNLSYRYSSSSKLVINQLNKSIKANQFTCIIGSSGAGKSTLLDLMLGLITPSEGAILIDSAPLTKNNLDSWLRNIGYVPQTIQLFEATIAENIAFGVDQPDIDMDKVIQVAEIADIHSFIKEELPNGYDTRIGDAGLLLSGGQKQRIGLARSLYHNPRVLILDEATNELDMQTEARILDSLQLIKELTIVFVTHKPSVFERANALVEIEVENDSNGSTSK